MLYVFVFLLLVWFRVFVVTALSVCLLFLFKQKTAYVMRISDWSSDVCSSDLRNREGWIPQARKEFFEGVLAMSSRDEQARWTAFYSKDNPKSPQSVFTDLDTVFIAIKSVTFVSTNVAQIRFTKTLQQIGRASCRERVCQSV